MRSKKLTLPDFAGEWKVERQISDHLAASSGRFSGSCEFAARDGEADVLYYSEKGTIEFESGEPLEASRNYIYRAGATKNEVDVLFSDGRPFHTIKLRQTMPSDTHFCEPDAYDVTYDFRYWPKWSSLWTVRGPRKNYKMKTEYTLLSN